MKKVYSLENARKVKYLAKALAHDVRQSLLQALVDAGGQSDLKSIKAKSAEIVGKKYESGVYSQHFNILIKAELVTREMEGRETICKLNKEYFKESTRLVDLLAELKVETKI